MGDIRLGVIEAKFADIIWKMEPVVTSELVKECEKELSWKRTTTYTVLKRLSERGIFQNIDGVVTSLISKDEFYSLQSEQFVEETFEGSLPAFLAAFTARKPLSREEIKRIREMIDAYEEE